MAFQFPSKFTQRYIQKLCQHPNPKLAFRNLQGACKRGCPVLRFVRLGLCPPCLAQLRASSIATLDDGARCGRRQRGPRWSAWRRRALHQGLVRLARRTNPGLANPAKEPIARLLAPPGAPFPSFEGRRKTGTKGPPRDPKPNPRDSEALAEEHAAN